MIWLVLIRPYCVYVRPIDTIFEEGLEKIQESLNNQVLAFEELNAAFSAETLPIEDESEEL